MFLKKLFYLPVDWCAKAMTIGSFCLEIYQRSDEVTVYDGWPSQAILKTWQRADQLIVFHVRADVWSNLKELSRIQTNKKSLDELYLITGN
ncbi:hypothetical protein NPIL_168081 [Nephila pilipes]|uniref:Uncharacterized protein n=1 Tax=Nephila pilipes TaxID=299642 RepID=A0A8X6T3M1_NEPPI|nr:hypothetical protein NPIL_168081 [Nephila pilipes]